MNKIIIELEAEPEEESPEHYERVMGCTDGFAKSVREVRKTAEGRWWWCSVKVTVTLPDGRQGTSYLGGCCYYSAYDFAASGGYFNDKVREAIEDAKKGQPTKLTPTVAFLP